jgi:hypothetical protein
MPNAGGVADGVSAAFNLSETYEYYLSRHGRNSFDASGSSIVAYVRYGQQHANASWNPGLRVMQFGDGHPFAASLDVVAHELTHGATEASAGLVYRGQSGALNEAFSDIFPLRAPVIDGTETEGVVAYAQTLDFTADGRNLIYDALNVLPFPGGFQLNLWSIYALDMDQGRTRSLVDPIPGLNISNPALSQTSDNFLAFSANDGLNFAVIATKLSTGARAVVVGPLPGVFSLPSYTGDDTAIVYSQGDPFTRTGTSLVLQPLAPDRITPRGSASAWLSDGAAGVIYRRGVFSGPATPTSTATQRPSPSRTPTPGRSPTSTPTRIPTQVSTATRERTATATVTARATCVGDCNGDGRVLINEVITGVNIGLDLLPIESCPAADRDGNRRVVINEVITAVNNGLNTCSR